MHATREPYHEKYHLYRLRGIIDVMCHPVVTELSHKSQPALSCRSVWRTY